MNYSELIQAYFERANALQWYWTVYILVIGGILGFSSFRVYKDLVTTILVTVLYACFAYKNLGAIEDTLLEQQALLAAIREYPVSGADAANVQRVRDVLEPRLTSQEHAGRTFHVLCDLMTIAVMWVKEWRRRDPDQSPTVRVN